MTNRTKHMAARSHRSYGKNYSVFNSFQFNANAKKSKKELKRKMSGSNLLEKASSIFGAIKDKFHKSQGR